MKMRLPFTGSGLLCLLSIALFAQAVTAYAEESIGVAVIIRNDVNGFLATRNIKINTGENVFRDEAVKTGQESTAKLVFADDTNLALGPVSTVTLDKFVFAGPADYKKAAVELVQGSFRFMTGNSNKHAYEINTTVATLGVRGTVLDVRTEPARTLVVLQEGGVLACTRSTPLRCVFLSRPGDTAIITARDVTRARGGGSAGWSFASLCASEGALCEKTRVAARQDDKGSSRGETFFNPDAHGPSSNGAGEGPAAPNP
jgi:hypothetical protein